MTVSDDGWLAALPMYDFDELTAAHDQLWTALAVRLDGVGITGLPTGLSRNLDDTYGWRHPRLLLGQGCEYPLTTRFAGSVRVVATPHYDVPGSDGPRCSSAIVVARDHPARRLEDLRGARCVINARDSNSGMNLLRAAIAPLMKDHPRGDRPRGSHFFTSVVVSGAHRHSASMIADGQADVAAIDCVTFSHLQRLYPATTSRLRLLGWTPSSPALPFITARSTSDALLQALRLALKRTLQDPALGAVRTCLRLVDVDIDVAPDPEFSDVRHLEQMAAEHGYPVLA